jgi:broad specificity phosphatase PhoE
MTRSDLIDAILNEMDRVWGDEGFSGAWEEYEWLLEHYGVTEDEDVEWSGILEYEAGEVDPDDEANPQWMSFVTADERVIPFLEQLLKKYRSNTVVVPPDLPEVVRRVDPRTGAEIREVLPRAASK